MLSNQHEFEAAAADFYKAQELFLNNPTIENEETLEAYRELMFQANYHDLFEEQYRLSWLDPRNLAMLA